MATGPVANQGKGKFLRGFLASNRDAKVVDATLAWKAEGHDDGISESLMSKIRSELGLTGRRGKNGGGNVEDASSKVKGKSRPKSSKAKGTPEAEEAPPQPNGRGGEAGPGKSEFVGEVLGREPEANLKAVNEAWASAGFGGQISPSIYYKVKRERGLNGEPSPGEAASPGTSEPVAAEAEPTVGGREDVPQLTKGSGTATVTVGAGRGASGDLGRVVDEVEAGIDDLMFRLKVNGGMAEVEAALRAARRLLVRSQG